MKKTGFFMLASLLLASGAFAQRAIVVTNSTDTDRKGEIVEVRLDALKASFDTKSYVLKNSQHKEVAYQLIKNGQDKPQSLIFQADVKAKSSSTYSLVAGKPAAVKPKTFARFVPERKDDFAWENDMAAYRMYGPALANENPSNGVDFWSKSTDNLVVDQRYRDDIYNEISYHIDHGFGLDFYKVAHTLGCGGIAPFATGKLWVGNYFNRYKIVEVGPLRSVFTLIYDSVKVDNSYYKEEITITADAGSLLNKAVVKYTGVDKKMELAAGIFLHDGLGVIKQNTTLGTLAYAENAVSDAKVPSGRNYIGVFIPVKVTEVRKDADHALILANYKAGDSFTYYFGGGWSKWHYSTDVEWFSAVNKFAADTKAPLRVTLK
jgi:hypothetical protein